MPKVPGSGGSSQWASRRFDTSRKPRYAGIGVNGAGPPKSAQHGPRGKRVVHVLPVIGKALYSRALRI
eukprot:5962581-Pyramimonas_sp.AAC.1